MVVMSARMNRAWGALHRAFYLSSRGVDAGDLEAGPASASVPGPIFRSRMRRMRSPAQGFGYAVMNLGLGSGGSMIHTEMTQGFRPSGATSEQLTSNFRPNGLLAWLVTGLFSGWFSKALWSSAQLPREKPKDMKNFALDAPVG
jgi:hypothetical protein